MATEFSRNYLFTGFPWGNLGYTQVRNGPVAQLASLGGVYAVAGLVVLVNCVVAAWWSSTRAGGGAAAAVAGHRGGGGCAGRSPSGTGPGTSPRCGARWPMHPG